MKSNVTKAIRDQKIIASFLDNYFQDLQEGKNGAATQVEVSSKQVIIFDDENVFEEGKLDQMEDGLEENLDLKFY